MIDTNKLKSMLWSILGILAFYGIVSVISWAIYEYMLEEAVGKDLNVLNFVGAFMLILMVNLVTKLTFNDTKRTNISQSVSKNG